MIDGHNQAMEKKVSDAYDIIAAGDLIAVKFAYESRKIDGTLANPPRVFVLVNNQQQDTFRIAEMQWAVAETLRPDTMAQIHLKLEALRNLQTAREQLANAERRVAALSMNGAKE